MSTFQDGFQKSLKFNFNMVLTTRQLCNGIERVNNTVFPSKLQNIFVNIFSEKSAMVKSKFSISSNGMTLKHSKL